jgi:hypothetical protein
LCLAGASRGRAAGQDFGMIGPAPPPSQEILRRQVLGAATQAFRPSLEMKENVDFLLTPALLVQEAMSSEAVITYPSE